jgi:hypothetical protein
VRRATPEAAWQRAQLAAELERQQQAEGEREQAMQQLQAELGQAREERQRPQQVITGADADLAAELQMLQSANGELHAQLASLADEKDHAMSLLQRERAEREHERAMLMQTASTAVLHADPPRLDAAEEREQASTLRAMEQRVLALEETTAALAAARLEAQEVSRSLRLD